MGRGIVSFAGPSPFAQLRQPGRATRWANLTCLTALVLALGRPALAAPQDSISPLRVRGDMRLRGELDRDRREAPGRERARLRFRVAAERDLGPGLTLGARLVTAPDPGDPNSTHQDLGAGFRNLRLALDRAYIRWAPDAPWPLEVLAGKFEPPFLAPPVFGELVWDADIQPDGIAVVLEPVPAVRLVGGGYLLLHQSSGTDVNLGAAQMALRARPATGLVVRAVLGTYLYGTGDRAAARRLARDNQGNLLTTGASGDTLAFASRFRLWNGHAAITYDGLPLPVTVAAEYIANASAAAGLDADGFALGGRLGRLGRPGRWQLDYQYQSVGREAIFSAVAQDDFLDATNFHGHLLGLAIQHLPGASVHLWTLWSRKAGPREPSFQKRYRVDLNFSWSL